MAPSLEAVLLRLIADYGGLAWVDRLPAAAKTDRAAVDAALAALAAQGEIIFDEASEGQLCVWRRHGKRRVSSVQPS